MQILTPEKIKTEKAGVKSETEFRLRDMALEEERLVQSINDLHVEEIATRDTLEKTKVEVRQEFISVLDTLKREVADLENKKREAMRPIDELNKEANDRITAVASREQAAATKETALDEREKNIRERETIFLEFVANKRQDLSEREEIVATREDRATKEDTRLSASANTLTTKWADFHETVRLANESLETREAHVIAGEKANVIRASALDEVAKGQIEKERGLVDGYATLESARKEILEGVLQ